MDAKPESADQLCWTLDATAAALTTPYAAAVVNLLNPAAGLSKLQLVNDRVDGYVLGVSPNSSAKVEHDEIADVYVRGNDLVVTYGQNRARPFSLQVYWSATVSERGILLLDTVLSLQTALLESFPDLLISTRLPAKSMWHVHDETEPMSVEEFNSNENRQFMARGANGILLREICKDWSYAEMTHPQDSGECRVGRDLDGLFSTVRKVGNSFLEKGVIRRLRVRGALLPRENDLDLARNCLKDLRHEAPPLTA